MGIRGNPIYGVYQSSPSSKNLFAGHTGIATNSRDPSAALEVGGDIHYSGSLLRKTNGDSLHPVMLGSSTGGEQKTISGTSTLSGSGDAIVRVSKRELAGLPLAQYEVSAYTLTAIGAPMPNLHVSVELRDNGVDLVFGVSGGVPLKRASWMLVL